MTGPSGSVSWTAAAPPTGAAQPPPWGAPPRPALPIAAFLRVGAAVLTCFAGALVVVAGFPALVTLTFRDWRAATYRLATALAVTSAAPTTDAGEADVAGRGAGDAAPVPVQRGDLDYSPALARLAMSCAAGESASCDVLYGAQDPFSDYSSYGSTCGGRTEVEYDGTCDELFD